jgi:hypothetical protein
MSPEPSASTRKYPFLLLVSVQKSGSLQQRYSIQFFLRLELYCSNERIILEQIIARQLWTGTEICFRF